LALGARRATILKMYTVEFAAIGILSSVIAGLLTGGFTMVALNLVLHRAEWTLEWKTIGGAMVISTVLTVCAGWLPAYGLLRLKPMEVLRAFAKPG
jgi:ABC-type antimicrobial peptide transport system permease subunit